LYRRMVMLRGERRDIVPIGLRQLRGSAEDLRMGCRAKKSSSATHSLSF
jgi:hypothetical protein